MGLGRFMMWVYMGLIEIWWVYMGIYVGLCGFIGIYAYNIGINTYLLRPMQIHMCW
jgi:hypothetical protein